MLNQAIDSEDETEEEHVYVDYTFNRTGNLELRDYGKFKVIVRVGTRFVIKSFGLLIVWDYLRNDISIFDDMNIILTIFSNEIKNIIVDLFILPPSIRLFDHIDKREVYAEDLTKSMAYMKIPQRNLYIFDTNYFVTDYIKKNNDKLYTVIRRDKDDIFRCMFEYDVVENMVTVKKVGIQSGKDRFTSLYLRKWIKSLFKTKFKFETSKILIEKYTCPYKIEI
jgi:hypothetical protein